MVEEAIDNEIVELIRDTEDQITVIKDLKDYPFKPNTVLSILESHKKRLESMIL